MTYVTGDGISRLAEELFAEDEISNDLKNNLIRINKILLEFSTSNAEDFCKAVLAYENYLNSEMDDGEKEFFVILCSLMRYSAIYWNNVQNLPSSKYYGPKNFRDVELEEGTERKKWWIGLLADVSMFAFISALGSPGLGIFFGAMVSILA